MFTDAKGKPVCLVCGADVAVMKEYNLRRHYETKHQDKYKHLDMKQKLQKEEDSKRSLVSQQTVFVKAKSQSEAAVKASFIVVAEIAKAAQPFTEGESVKNGMIQVCPDKRQAFFLIETLLLIMYLTLPPIYNNSWWEREKIS